VQPRRARGLGQSEDVCGAADAPAPVRLDECLDLTELHGSDIEDFYTASKSIGLFYIKDRAYDARAARDIQAISGGGRTWEPTI
jgi:hypothetical protein